MAAVDGSRGTQSFAEYKAERRKVVAHSGEPSDYDAEVSARVVGDGVLREWPACTCGADTCPDKSVA
ncbi:hypothetical protein GCM10009759_17250 [Kitasatospora saccharophila]|uniref:Uncharacterized protein n=1 Tax=Kitasatospora saccharophila TaxID=407973 RepID=A0ABN2WH62_9ACTN